MYVPEIIEMKNKLDQLKQDGLIASWELPYENLLTRLSAAIFFVTPAQGADPAKIWETLGSHKDFSYRLNEEQKLSTLQYRITFNPEEKKEQESAPGAALSNA